MTLVCVMAAAEEQSGWDAVARNLLVGNSEPPTARRRGRPAKVRPAVPSDSSPGPSHSHLGSNSDGVGAHLANIAGTLLAQCHSTMSSVGSFLQRRLWSGLKEGSQGAGRPDKDNPAKCLLQKLPVISVAAHGFIGDRSGSKQTLSRDEKRVGCCALLFSGHLVGLFLQQCASFTSKGWQVLAVYKLRRYDETPTKIKVKETEKPEIGDQTAKTEVAKVFQTELSIGILMWHATTKRCTLMRVGLPTMMSVVDSATAENVKKVPQLAISRKPCILVSLVILF